MTDQDKAQLSSAEQQFADEMTRIANRQMQVVTRLDTIQDKLAVNREILEDVKKRIGTLEEKGKQPASLVERIIIPLMVFNLSLTIGNVAMTLTVAIALANHMLGK